MEIYVFPLVNSYAVIVLLGFLVLQRIISDIAQPAVTIEQQHIDVSYFFVYIMALWAHFK